MTIAKKQNLKGLRKMLWRVASFTSKSKEKSEGGSRKSTDDRLERGESKAENSKIG